MPISKQVHETTIEIHENACGFLILEIGDKDGNGRRGAAAAIYTRNDSGEFRKQFETLEVEPAGFLDVVTGIVPKFPQLLGKLSMLVGRVRLPWLANAVPVAETPSKWEAPELSDDDDDSSVA